MGDDFTFPDEDRIPGNPDAAEALSSKLGAVREQVRAARSDLLATNEATLDWEGEAALAFRSAVGDLPDELEKVHSSYDGLAWTLWKYGNDLRDIQDRSRRAERKVNDAARLHDEAKRLLNSQDPSVQAKGQAEDDVAGRDYRNARNDADAAKRDFDNLVRWCRDRIDQASEAGMKNSLGTAFDRYVVDDLGGVVVGAAGLVYDVVIKPLASLPHDLEEFAEHPSFAGLGKILGDVSGVLSVAALLIPGLGEAILVVDVARLGADTIAYAEGDISLSQVGMDAASVAFDGISVKADAGATAARSEARTVSSDVGRQAPREAAASAKASQLEARASQGQAKGWWSGGVPLPPGQSFKPGTLGARRLSQLNAARADAARQATKLSQLESQLRDIRTVAVRYERVGTVADRADIATGVINDKIHDKGLLQ